MGIMSSRRKNGYLLLLAVVAVLAIVVGVILHQNREEEDLSPLSIGNALSAMTSIGEVSVVLVDEASYAISPDLDFLHAFEQDLWEEKDMEPLDESQISFKIVMQEEYEIYFYLDGEYASVYSEETTEKHRYYSIPEGAYESLVCYVLENGDRIDDEAPITEIGYITGFEESKFTQITFDPVEWITFEDTERMKEVGLDEEDMPNGYYIYNPEIEEEIYPVDEDTEYRYIDWENAFDDGDELHTITTNGEEFCEHLKTYENSGAYIPFWVTVKNGILEAIEEQYVP